MELSVNAVLFDLDNTLADRVGAFRRLCMRFWEDEPAVNGTCDFETAYALLNDWDSDGSTLPKAKIFHRALDQWGSLTRSPAELQEWYEKEYSSFFKPDERVTELARLLVDADMPWGIVTNGPPFQERVVEQIGLSDLHSGLVISASFGASKPDPGIFREGMRLIAGNVRPEEYLFVGDNPVADIGGAASLGMKTAWVRRDRTWAESGYSPDVVVDHVSELATVLRK